MKRRYLLETMTLAPDVIAYRCTDVMHRRQVLSGAESTYELVHELCNRQLDLIRRGCDGRWEIELDVAGQVPR